MQRKRIVAVGLVIGALVAGVPVLRLAGPAGGSSAGTVAPVGGEEPGARCGEEVDGRPTVTQFALQPEQSETDLRIRTAETASFNLVYASSCVVDPADLDVDVTIEPGAGDARDLPPAAEADLVLRPRRDGLTVTLPVARADLAAGSYEGMVVLSGPDVATVRTPVTVSVKDRRWYLPVAATAAGLVAGVAVAAFAALSNRRETFHPLRDTWTILWSPWGVVALLAAAGLGYFVPDGPFQTGFVNDDRWVWTAGSGLAMVARSFATGTGSVVGTLLVRGTALQVGPGRRRSGEPPGAGGDDGAGGGPGEGGSV